jgi:hypothetical protein
VKGLVEKLIMLGNIASFQTNTHDSAISAGFAAGSALRPVGFFEWPMAWAMIFLLLIAEVVWAWQIGLTIGGAGSYVCASAAPLMISALYRRRNRRIANMAEAWALWFAFTPTVVVLTYLAATSVLPLQDDLLAHLDQALGFDWLVWRKWVEARPAVSWALVFAYFSLVPQTIFALIYFPATGKSERVGELFLLSGAAAAVTASIWAIVPALGPFAKYFSFDVPYVQDVSMLRASGPWHFELWTMGGIVTMPSYHTVMALLIAYAFRHTGPLGFAIAALNSAMLLSVLPIGGHYLVDVLAGSAIAFGVVAIQRRARQ